MCVAWNQLYTKLARDNLVCKILAVLRIEATQKTNNEYNAGTAKLVVDKYSTSVEIEAAVFGECGCRIARVYRTSALRIIANLRRNTV